VLGSTTWNPPAEKPLRDDQAAFGADRREAISSASRLRVASTTPISELGVSISFDGDFTA
jgi:hypothetical protein